MNIEKFLGIKLEQNILYKTIDLIPIKSPSKQIIYDKDLDEDTVSISDEAKKLLAEEERLEKLEEESREMKEMLRQLREASNDENPYMDRIKCLQIALRIMTGHNVPRKDEIFLMEKEPQMYSNAILLRQHNDDAKDYDSILDDEKDNDSTDPSEPFSFQGSSESSSVESISIDSVPTSSDIEP